MTRDKAREIELPHAVTDAFEKMDRQEQLASKARAELYKLFADLLTDARKQRLAIEATTIERCSQAVEAAHLVPADGSEAAHYAASGTHDNCLAAVSNLKETGDGE
jgi:hypothetical protein